MGHLPSRADLATARGPFLVAKCLIGKLMGNIHSNCKHFGIQITIY